MSARWIAITGKQPRCGKTHFTSALARWLVRHGHAVEVLHLGGPSLARVVAADGSTISRPAAILAEAALVESGGRHEDARSLEALSAASEFVLIESSGEGPSNAALTLQLSLAEGGYRLEGYGKLPAWNGPPIVPETPPDVAEMDAWRVGGWPRVGVVSLLNLSNFSDFQILRGAEWVTAPAPGKFAVLFLPETADPIGDQAWLERQALSAWLRNQQEDGCRLVSVGWKAPGAEVIESGDLRDHVFASRLIGRRLDPPLPAEETFDRLSAWLGAWSRHKSLIDKLEAVVVK
jgi:hypothetical protein